jgi:hypothetical protein
MIDPVILAEIRRSVQSCVELDKPLLQQLINEAQPLLNNQRRIQRVLQLAFLLLPPMVEITTSGLILFKFR